jgi:putative mRNA 3-end processing factor
MIHEKDGIHIQGSQKVVADSSSSIGDINLISHAHSDHALKKEAKQIICSKLTAKMSEERFGNRVKFSESHENIDLLPSGHILGSRAALIDESVLYTGDVSIQDRTYLEGFKPVKADKLVIESTYGIPAYTLPNQRKVVKQITDWVKDNRTNLFLFGYSLGRAQKIQYIVQEATDRPIIAHEAVIKMNKVIEKHTDLEFRAKPYKENKELLEKDAIMIAPSRSSKADYTNKAVEKHDGVKAGFSGWAVQESYRYRGGYDKIFPLSDHCGFEDLVELVKQVDPEKVYTHHGFDEEFASYLKKELGIDARALKNNQRSLTDF